MLVKEGDKLKKFTKDDQINRKMRMFLAKCRRLVPADQSLYPIIRLMLPFQDKARGSYRMKESVLADVYIDFLQLGKTSKDALRLKNYRAPKLNDKEVAGDFASELYEVVRDGRSYDGLNLRTITCADINRTLDDIVGETEGRKAVGAILKDLFKNTGAVQQKWFVRLILKQMKFTDVKVLNALHPDAREMFECNADLVAVCRALPDPDTPAAHLTIQLMSVFKPMLADRKTNIECVAEAAGGEFFIDTKYDGERWQLHWRGEECRVFSRNGHEFTSDYTNFTSLVPTFLAPSVQDIILVSTANHCSIVANCFV